jgi:hypothetical protein
VLGSQGRLSVSVTRPYILPFALCGGKDGAKPGVHRHHRPTILVKAFDPDHPVLLASSCYTMDFKEQSPFDFSHPALLARSNKAYWRTCRAKSRPLTFELYIAKKLRNQEQHISKGFLHTRQPHMHFSYPPTSTQHGRHADMAAYSRQVLVNVVAATALIYEGELTGARHVPPPLPADHSTNSFLFIIS